MCICFIFTSSVMNSFLCNKNATEHKTVVSDRPDIIQRKLTLLAQRKNGICEDICHFQFDKQ